MNKSLSVLLGLILSTLVGASILGAAQKSFSGIKELKRQQKLERKQLQMTQKIWKKSFRGRHIPRAEKLAIEHQYKWQMRNLKMQQKEQLQRMKDQQKVWKVQQRHLYSGGTMIQ
ncbi:MAG TPA: hypothetical protein VKW70_08855 [Terriglobia bacterium]|nr:hypothetical protein [Terriglobia bacterium]